MRLYIDANPIIYAFEGEPGLKSGAMAWLRQARFDPGITLLTSRLTRLEVRYKPIRTGNLELLAHYDRLFESPAIEIVSLSDSILEAATILRAKNAGAADAIHIATALNVNAH